jgi:hypothetical protein
MDSKKTGLEGEASRSQPKRNDIESVYPAPSKNKLLAIVQEGYIKLYAENYSQLSVVHAADCSELSGVSLLKAEALAIEIAESNVPVGFRHLLDERFLVNSISTRCPSVTELARFESIREGMAILDAVGRKRRGA